MIFLALDILKSGVTISMVFAVLGLLFAFLLIKAVIRLSAGNVRMRQIAGAVDDGAKAYLKRQVVTISVIALVIFGLLFKFRDALTALGFLIGASRLLAARYVRMRLAGMAADVFETYAVSLIGAILVGALTLGSYPAAVIYPFVLGGISVLGAVLGILFVNIAGGRPASVLMGAVGASGLVSAILFWPATHMLFPNPITIGGIDRSANDVYLASLVGLLMTFVVVVISNYYTSTRYAPVRKIAKASETGHA